MRLHIVSPKVSDKLYSSLAVKLLDENDQPIDNLFVTRLVVDWKTGAPTLCELHCISVQFDVWCDGEIKYITTLPDGRRYRVIEELPEKPTCEKS